MMYKYFGKVFKIPFPFIDLSGKKSRPALAVSEPDELNDIEFLFITTKTTRYFDRILPIHQQDYSDKELPFESIVHVGKPYLLNDSVVGKYLCQMTAEFMEKVLRELNYRETRRFYNYFHAPERNKPFRPGQIPIPYAGRVFDEKEMISLVDSALDFWLTAGRFADQFEKEFTNFLGVKHCLPTNSGSSANLLAISALTSPSLGDRCLKPGDEVITVACAFPTTVNPIIQNNLIPVFLDIELGTYNIQADKIEAALSEKTRAIFLAHTLGNPFDLDRVLKVAKKHNLWFIEDNCDALGSKYNGQYTGTFGHIATYSFYPPHHMTMGEGGALTTNDNQLKRLIESFRDWGRDCWCEPGHDDTCGKRFGWQLGTLPYGYDHKYAYSHIGYSLKVTDMQAAVGVAQFKKLSDFIEARKKNWELLYKGLKKYEDYFILPKATDHSDPSWFGFVLTVKESAPFSKNSIVNYLENNKIATRMLFAGNIVRHPSFENVKYRVYDDLKNTDFIMNNTFWIGVYPGLTEEMISFVIEKIREFVKGEKWKAKH